MLIIILIVFILCFFLYQSENYEEIEENDLLTCNFCSIPIENEWSAFIRTLNNGEERIYCSFMCKQVDNH